MSLLGYIVSANHVKLNINKIESFEARSEPIIAKQVQQCLEPLYSLIEKDVKFVWTEECRRSYAYNLTCLIRELAMVNRSLSIQTISNFIGYHQWRSALHLE